MVERFEASEPPQIKIHQVDPKRLPPRWKVDGKLKPEKRRPDKVLIYTKCDSYLADRFGFGGIVPEGEERNIAFALNEGKTPIQAVVVDDLDVNRLSAGNDSKNTYRDQIIAKYERIFGIHAQSIR